jgi:hypothetical protein
VNAVCGHRILSATYWIASVGTWPEWGASALGDEVMELSLELDIGGYACVAWTIPGWTWGLATWLDDTPGASVMEGAVAVDASSFRPWVPMLAAPIETVEVAWGTTNVRAEETLSAVRLTASDGAQIAVVLGVDDNGRYVADPTGTLIMFDPADIAAAVPDGAWRLAGAT